MHSEQGSFRVLSSQLSRFTEPSFVVETNHATRPEENLWFNLYELYFLFVWQELFRIYVGKKQLAALSYYLLKE